ncbi:MAG: fused MFS/spermidine synthase [Caldimonas sp.]
MKTIAPAAWRGPIALLLMAASGFAGLGYQIVWTQQSSVWLGHESAAVLAVVAAFFGGLALGAFTMGPRIERSARPLRWYVASELAIAAWGLVLIVAMAPFGAWALDLTGAQPSVLWQWTVAFCATFLLLLPATAAMGATLPAIERATAQWRLAGRSIAAPYASNTFGAVLGVLATAFWLLPELGLARTAGVCIALNLFCAVGALAALTPHAAPVAPPSASSSPARRAALARLAATGLLGIGYEVLVARVLGQLTEDTVYTFAMLLAVYLVGSAFGAAFYRHRLERRGDSQALGDRLFCALAAACLIGTASLWAAERIKTALQQALGPSMSAAVSAEAALALAAFGLPTIVMGALFSHLSARASADGASFGQSLAVNTLGAAVAPLLFGVLLAPALGPKSALLLVASGYLALTTRRARLRAAVWGPALIALALAALAPPLAFVDMPDGGHIVSYREGTMAAVSVVEDRDGVARLRIDNRQQEGSNSSLLVDGRQALLPVLLHRAPKRALFLGLGTGITASVAAQDPTLQVDAVELLPEVIAASRYFTAAVDDGKAHPRLHLIASDARRYVRATPQQYDVIVADNFHPARSGSGALYTVEHFEAVRARMAEGGIFCQWLPLHQLDLATLRSIVRSFIDVYPNGAAILASNSLETPVLGLVGTRNESRFDIDAVRDRLARTAFPMDLAGFGIDDEYALLGSFVAGPKALARFAGDAPANTDDRPIVAYRAPRVTYAPDSRPRDRLIALLHELVIAPGDVMAFSTDPDRARRLAAYWTARNRFIEAGRDVRPSANVQQMLAQVREPLLSVLRTSPDFRPAYDPLMRMATILARADKAASRALLAEIAQTQPGRPAAGPARLQPADARAPLP